MQSHSWLIILTVAAVATISYGKKPFVSMNDDALATNLINSTEDDNLRSKLKQIPMADNPMFNKMLPDKHFDAVDEKTSEILKKKKTTTTTTTSQPTTKGNDDDDEFYADDYDYSTYEDNDEFSNTTTKAINGTTKAAVKVTTETIVKLKPIGGSDQNMVDDSDDEYDDDGDDSDDSNESVEAIKLEAQQIDNFKCPRDCICTQQMTGYMVASCSRLDAGIQNFSNIITDLEIVNITQQFPIVLNAGFFRKIGLQHVSSIKIVNSFIATIHPLAFEGLNNLYSVNLTNSGLNFISPDTFADNKKLRILTLAGNDLNAMQQDAAPFNEYMLKAPSVEELDISGCNLKKLLPTAFNRLENIVFINLANNELQTLPVGLFDHVETIEELDLSSNNISNLPKGIFNRTSLAILNLKYNNIESRLDFATPEIQKIDLSFNKITSISSTMFSKMIGLTSLVLKGNLIKKIQQLAFFALKDLRQIDLSYNNLEQLSSQIFLGNQDLDVIRLNDNNRLKKLPLEGFESETGTLNVYLFDASNCDISELGDDTFNNMPKLTTLNLAWNNIETLSKEFFKGLTQLVELNLNNNLISEFNNHVFVTNGNLKKLNLAGNPLTKLTPEMFLPLKQLSELDVSYCDLMEIWSSSMSSVWLSSVLKNLKLFNVSNNNIVHARHTHFSTMQNLKVLDLSNNHLHCDEGFKELMKWLAERKIKPGNLHVGFNAELKMNGAAEIKKSYSWDLFENQTCLNAHAINPEIIHAKENEDDVEDLSEAEDENDDDDSEEIVTTKPTVQKPIVNEIVDNVDGGDSDSEDDDDDDEDDDDEYDDENEIELDSGKELKNEESMTAVEIDALNNRINKLEDEFLDDDDKLLIGQYRYMIPILIILFSILALMLLIAKLVSILMHRRGERYRQALLASKNSIIYQKLSEEIGGPQTPKFHRYSPINQV